MFPTPKPSHKTEHKSTQCIICPELPHAGQTRCRACRVTLTQREKMDWERLSFCWRGRCRSVQVSVMWAVWDEVWLTLSQQEVYQNNSMIIINLSITFIYFSLHYYFYPLIDWWERCWIRKATLTKIVSRLMRKARFKRNSRNWCAISSYQAWETKHAFCVASACLLINCPVPR